VFRIMWARPGVRNVAAKLCSPTPALLTQSGAFQRPMRGIIPYLRQLQGTALARSQPSREQGEDSWRGSTRGTSSTDAAWGAAAALVALGMSQAVNPPAECSPKLAPSKRLPPDPHGDVPQAAATLNLDYESLVLSKGMSHQIKHRRYGRYIW
jgi:hypothetical protein